MLISQKESLDLVKCVTHLHCCSGNRLIRMLSIQITLFSCEIWFDGFSLSFTQLPPSSSSVSDFSFLYFGSVIVGCVVIFQRKISHGG